MQKNHSIEQVGRYMPCNDGINLPDPLVMRAGIMQSSPSYKITRCTFTDEHILCLVTQGRGWLTMAGRKTDIAAGDMFCIFPEITAEYGTHPLHLMHKSWLGFTGTQVAGLIQQLGLLPSHPVISLGATMQVVLPIINEIRRELIVATPGYTWWATGLLWQVLGSLCKRINKPNENTPPSVVLIRQAARYIDMHYADISSVSDLAKHTEFSRSHFSTMFKKETGLSPLEYLTEVRLAKAESLLSQTSYSIKSIALSVGIQDRAYFSRLFKLKRGISPQLFRLTQQRP